MADKVKGITIEIGADSSKFKKGIDNATSALDKAQSALKGFATGVGTVVTAAATAATAAGAALIKGASEAAEYGDSIDKMSQKLGISAEAYQEWAFIAEHSGTSIDSLQSSFTKLAKAAQGGSKEFEALGISLEDAKQMSTEDLFSAVVAGLQDMEEGTERTTLATALLGKGASELGPLLNTTAEDTEAMRIQVHELGGVMSNESVKSAAAFQDSLQNAKTALKGLTRNLTSQFMPEITNIMDGFTNIISGDMDEGNRLIKKGVEDFAQKLIDGMPAFLENMSSIMLALVDVIIENLPAIIKMGIEIIIKLALGLVEAIPDLVAKIPEIIKAIVDTFAEYDWLEIGRNIMEGLKNGLLAAWDVVKRAVINVCDKIGDTFKDFFGIASPSKLMKEEVGGNLMKGLDAGLDKYSDLAIEEASSISGALQQAFSGSFTGLQNSVSRTSNITLTTPVYLDGSVIASVVNQQLGVLL